MSELRQYITVFFDKLEVFEDLERGHCYKIFMRQAALEFLSRETKDNAFAVYRAFFDSYRIRLRGATNPFIDLLDVLKSYEENAAVLIDRQRDHYIHSVNVFLLGLSVYAANARYRRAFDETVMDKQEYPFSYDTKHEEFFYRWGLASLFHDVGYPLEIVGRQLNKFVDFAAGTTETDNSINVQLTFENFDEFNRISEIVPKHEFTRSYLSRYDSACYIDTLRPVDLLAHKLHTSLGADLNAVKSALDGFVDVMARCGFIDHGYYSAIIVLRWYGFLIQSARYKSEYFYWPVLDSASAILLHNYYRNVMQKKPFSMGPLSPAAHPVAYLLILCDELQEWNRQAYGILDRQCTQAARASVGISDCTLSLTYVSEGGALPKDFARDKKKLLGSLLDLGALFDAVSIHSRTVNKAVLPASSPALHARPELEDLERLARSIHELYNEKQMERYPDRPLKYPDFDALPDTLKYSNLRQAMRIPDKLWQMGYEMRPAGSAGETVSEIPEEYVEALAEEEHGAWMAERISTGWTTGADVNADRKTTPYLVPYGKLPEEIKELDRDPVRNIPRLLARIGMAAYRL